jgi:hypothetical protein
MPALTEAGRTTGQANYSGPITLEEVARITWATLPGVKCLPVAFEAKPLFLIFGGDRHATRKQ